jgi:hypothetical protein
MNLVTPQQVDDDLEGEIVEELRKYGAVKVFNFVGNIINEEMHHLHDSKPRG